MKVIGQTILQPRPSRLPKESHGGVAGWDNKQVPSGEF